MKIDAKTKLMESVRQVKHKVKFTDRFVKIHDVSNDIAMIDPLGIDFYYTGKSNETGADGVKVFMKSGAEFGIIISIGEFESILNEWYNK